jgi:hypothetical protein
MGSKGVALWGSINLGDIVDKEACTLGELPIGTVMLISESTVRAMRIILPGMEVNDCAIWDGKCCWHTASNTRLLVDSGMFVFKDPETEAWTL